MSVGDNTLSMTCITPLLVATSAIVTVASFTITDAPTLKDRVWPFAAVASIQSVTAEDGTSEGTT